MGTIGRIKFKHNCDICFASNLIAAILSGAQGDFSRVVCSFCFRELTLIDKILSETDIEYIEGLSWEESPDIDIIMGSINLNDTLSLHISTDKFEINTSLLEVDTLPEHFSRGQRDRVSISIQIKMTPEYSLQEENKAKEQLEVLCKQVFNDISTLHFCSSHDKSGTMSCVMASMKIPLLDFQDLSRLINYIAPTSLQVAYRVSINRHNKNRPSKDFIHKWERRPNYIYLPDGGWHRGDIYNMPFAVNGQGVLFPICNCNREFAFEFAKFVQNNMTLFKDFKLFFPNIVWVCDNKKSCLNTQNSIILQLSENKGMELVINYEQYKDSDPSLKQVRELINTNLHKFNISFNNAKSVII